VSLSFDYVKTIMFMKAKMRKNGWYEPITKLKRKSDIKSWYSINVFFL